MIGKLKNYFIKNVFFSTIRLTSYVLFYVGLILRFTNGSTDEELVAAKIVLAYDLELWFIRSLAFLSIAQKMGPKLVMIRKMVRSISFHFFSNRDETSLNVLDYRFVFLYLYHYRCYDCLWCCFSIDVQL